jgi:hypothetical protein
MTPQNIAILIAILTALSRVLPATRPLWNRLGRAKIIPPIAIVLIGYVLQGFASNDWLSGLELMVGAIVALLAPGVAEAGGKAAIACLLIGGALTIPACGALLDQIPPGTTVCVEVTVVGVTVRECATNNESATELEELALSKATKLARAKGLLP